MTLAEEVKAAFEDGRLRVEVDEPVSVGNYTSAVAGGGLEPGGKVTWVHVISKPAGGEIRGYAKIGDELRLRLPAYPMHWDEVDAEVCRRLGCTRVVLPQRKRPPIECKVCGETKPWEESGQHMCNACFDKKAAAKEAERYCKCCCCGEGFYTDKPQDPERDTGFGTCARCHELVAKSWVKHGFPGERPITMAQAKERLNTYA